MEETSEQQLIETYLKTHRLEECLDEIINHVVTGRPSNPFITLANAFQSKSFPEIIDVQLNSVLHQGVYGVKVSLSTSIGIFFAFAKYQNPPVDHNGYPEPKEYSIIIRKLKELLCSVDPTNLSLFDQSVAAITDIDRAESMALSIACCRAAAKYKNKELFQYISELFGIKSDDLIIPLPVASLCIFPIPSTTVEQMVHIIPIRSSSLELAIAKLNSFMFKLIQHDKITKPIRYSKSGTFHFDGNNFEELIKHLDLIIQEFEESNNLKLSIGYNGDELFRSSDNHYMIHNTAKNGTDVAEQLMNLWMEAEFISIDQPVSHMDIASLRQLKKRIQEIIFVAKTTNNDKFKYCTKGIGGDNGCNLQIPLDCASLPRDITVSDIDKLLLEAPYNIAKFHVQSFKNMSSILETYQKISNKLPIYVDCTSYGKREGTFDDFEADLAVGIGAVQLFGDGMFSSDYAKKLDRLLTIQMENEKIPFVGSKFRVGFT